MDPRVEGARDLILAVFRLAVADYLGLAFSHDGLGPVRRTRSSPFLAEAAVFLASSWASYLADLVGLKGPAIWREARRLAGDARDGDLASPALAA